MRILLLIYVINSAWKFIQTANILVTMPAPFYSHQATFRPLWRELSRRGHKITLLTTSPMDQNENITQIDWSSAYKIKNIQMEGRNIIQIITDLTETAEEILTEHYNSPDVVDLLQSDKQFDLIFSEIMNPWLSVFLKKFKSPFIYVCSMDTLPYLHGLMGNAIHPAIYEYSIFDIQSEMTFVQILMNTIFVSVMHFTPKIMFYPIEKLFTKITEGEYTSIFDIEKNVSLMFINANPIFYAPRPVTPITINIEGGLHFAEPRDLPQDLQSFLDESKHGCIYFSFGTTVDSNYLTKEALETFRKTFEALAPIRVLWKFANDTMAFKPSNVELRKWIPQHDVLRHPNVILFITQGGLQSMEEAVDTAVPMLGMPFFGDQINNVNKMVEKEFGLRLDVKTMDGNSLRKSIAELIENPKYKKNIDRLSAISKDKPINPLEKAVWWTEYVIRHKTTEHLRSPSADIPLYQYFFLDIMAFSLLVFIFTSIVFYYFFRLMRKIFVAIFCKKIKLKTT